MNLENEKIPSSVNAPDSYHKEFESRLLQRLGISADILQNPKEDIALPDLKLNPVTNATEPQKIARKQDPETIKSEAVSKEIDEVGNIHIEPFVVSTNENPEWVNFAAAETEANSSSVDGIKKVTHSMVEIKSENSDGVTEEIVSTVDSDENFQPQMGGEEVPSWNEIAGAEQEVQIQGPPVVVHHIPESVGFESTTPVNDAPKESKLYNQSEPGLDTLEPPPTPFAPIAGRVQNSSNSNPGWIGIAASVAAIVAAYFIWVAIQPASEEPTPVVISEPAPTEAPAAVAAPKDTVPAGIRLVENYILDEKLEKYKEPNVFSVHQLDELPEKSQKALNDLEHHNIAVFDMEDVLFEDLDLIF